MNISESMLENIARILIARLPPDMVEKAGQVIQAGLQLQAQMDRIEVRLAAIEISLSYIVAALKLRENPHLLPVKEHDENAGIPG